jgi:hypothetical protein
MQHVVSATAGVATVVFGVTFVLAGITDAIGSRVTAVAILMSLTVAVAAIVLAANRQRAVPGTISYSGVVSDWARSLVIVLGAVLTTWFASFYIVALLISLAEHQLLPVAFGGTLLEARREAGAMSIVGLVWLGFQFAWMVQVGLQIHRNGIGRGVDAFRVAFTSFQYGLALSLIALVALFSLGPSR